MPQFPQYGQRTSASAAGLGPGPSRTSGEELALGAEFASTVQKISLSRDAWALADATAKATGELEQYRGELDADEDFDSHGAKFLERAKDIQERYGASLGSGPASKVFSDEFARVSQSNAVQVQIDAQKLKAGKVRAEIGNTLFDLSQMTGLDQATDDAVRAHAHIAVEASSKTGNLSFAERNELLNKFDTDSSEAAIRRDMAADPELAEHKLAAGLYPKLSGESQAIWAQRLSGAAYTAQQRRMAEEERGYRLSERIEKERADALSKEGDTLLARNQLTPAWIESHSGAMDPEDKRYFYRALTGGGGEAPRDVHLYADLRDRAGRGEDVRNDARAALQRGEIRPTDFDRLLGEVEGARPNWYKRGSEYIATSSAVSELNPDPAAAATKATMLDQWADWAGEHPKASDREAQTAYQDIVEHNSLVKLNGLPMPRFASGPRLELNLEETESATVKAFQEGRIDQPEFQRQALLLDRWRAALGTPKKTTP